MEQVDRAKFGPPDDTPIMPWYEGAYSHGFVALHPFVTIDGLDPSTCEHGTLVLSGSTAPTELGLLEWADEEARHRRVGKEIDAEALDGLTKRFGKQVGWRTMCQEANVIDHCELDRALRTNIGGLRHDLADTASAARLVSYCDQHRIFMPTEGRFQPVMQFSLARLFRRAGFSDVIVGDEFGDDERLVDLDLLERAGLWDGMDELPHYGIKRLAAPDKSLLAWVHWDSFYTVIFGTAESFRETGVSRLFEGFWCSDATTTYWLTEACIPIVH